MLHNWEFKIKSNTLCYEKSKVSLDSIKIVKKIRNMRIFINSSGDYLKEAQRSGRCFSWCFVIVRHLFWNVWIMLIFWVKWMRFGRPTLYNLHLNQAYLYTRLLKNKFFCYQLVWKFIEFLSMITNERWVHYFLFSKICAFWPRNLWYRKKILGVKKLNKFQGLC